MFMELISCDLLFHGLYIVTVLYNRFYYVSGKLQFLVNHFKITRVGLHGIVIDISQGYQRKPVGSSRSL